MPIKKNETCRCELDKVTMDRGLILHDRIIFTTELIVATLHHEWFSNAVCRLGAETLWTDPVSGSAT